MIMNGEPGLLNMSRVRINNSWYFAPIQGTNPCGEACLEENGVCNLGSLILPNFIDSAGRVQWSKMEDVIYGAISFLDNCIDINRYSLWNIQQTAQRGRRIGLGVMGLADALFNCGIRYGSREAIDFIERLFKFIRNVSYESSIKLAMDKGTFPAYDSFNYCKSKFVRTLPPSLRSDIRKHGIRNVTVNAIAPTGTISLVAGTTSSIEPLAYKAYKRKDQVSERIYIHPSYINNLRGIASRNNSDMDYIVDSTDLGPSEHIETQVVVQKYIDGAVSKTILVPNDYNSSSLGDILLESIFDLKGITIYREGSREDQPITPLTEDEARECINNSSECADLETVNCARGTCEI